MVALQYMSSSHVGAHKGTALKGATDKQRSLRHESDVAVVVKRRPSKAAVLRAWTTLTSCVVAVVVASLLAYMQASQASSSTAASPAVEILVSNDHDAAAFVTWFKDGGGFMSDAIAIAHFPNMGRGIRASSLIAENDVTLSVPMDMIICRDTILKRVSSELRLKFLKLQTTGDELLTAFLVVEQLKNDSSHWAPYLRLLPAYPTSFQDIATPLFYDASTGALDDLQDERMIQAATQERQRAKLAFQRFRRLFKSILPSVSTHVGLSLEKRYLWARFLVNSRAFSIRGERYLVPFGDIFNGKPQPQRSATASAGNGAHFLQYHRLRQGVGMEIQADRAVDTPGEQVFEDYGDNNNYIYFLYHGFIMENNPFDCAALRLPSLETTDDAKRLLLRELDQSEGGSESSLVCVSARGTLQSLQDKKRMQVLASLATMDSRHREAWCNPRDRMMALCLSHATQADQDRLLVQAIQQHLDSFATTIDQDEQLLQASKGSSPGQRHAVRFRLSRKKILVSAMKELQQRRHQQDQHQTTAFTTQDSDSHNVHADQPSPATKLARFSHWISTFNFPVNHIELKYVSPSMGYGAFATKPLVKGEIYLSVPTRIVMDLQSAARSEFLRDWVVRHRSSTGFRWTESQLLLLHLLHEKFAPGHKSFWSPYLDLLPQTDRLASPLFFDAKSTELELLREAVPTDLALLIADYRGRVDAEYYEQLQSRKSLFPDWITLERFRWAHAILDSRSIWWSGSRHLVPLLDMVNCMELSPLHNAHATRLHEEGYDAAVTRASWDFAMGDHVVENYAQPNYIYLLYHGFVLHGNSHDCAHFHFDLVLARQLPSGDADRTVVIAQMERMQLYSWTPDVCVGGPRALDKLLRVALIAQSPGEAAAEERAHGQQLTPKHLDAAEKETAVRLQRLEKVLQRHTEDTATHVLTYISQQHELMAQILTLIGDRQQ